MRGLDPIRSTVFLYVGSFFGTAMGSLYWMIMGRMTSPETVGQAATAVTVMTLAVTIASLGVGAGLPRFLGRTAGRDNYTSFKRYVRGAFVVMLLSSAVVGLGLVLVGPVLEEQLSIPNVMTGFIVVTVGLAVLNPPFQAALVSLLRTDYVTVTGTAANVSKVAAGIFLVFLGFGTLGIFLGYTIMNVVLLVTSAVSLQYILRGRVDGAQEQQDSGDYHRQVVAAGLPSYVPAVVSGVGTHIGTLLVFGAGDAAQTGFYYISLQIYAAAVIAPSAIMTLLFPYICANPHRDADIMSRGVKYALALSFPLVSLMALYPNVPLGLMGEDYIPASLTLQLFALSVLPVAVINAATTLGYARGKYGVVLGIGMLTNVPRVILYFVLTPGFGSPGGAMAFLAGSVTGLSAAVVAALHLKMTLDAHVMAKIVIPSLVLSVLLYIAGLHWLIGIPVLLLFVGVAYARLGVLAKDETIGIVRAVLPETLRGKLAPHMMRVMQLVYGE